MGEPPANVESEINANFRLCRMYFEPALLLAAPLIDAGKQLALIKLSYPHGARVIGQKDPGDSLR